MDPLAIALTSFVACIGAASAGLVLRVKLPVDHLDGDSKDTVKMIIGLIATMAALVLGLLIASAQSSFTAQSSNVQHLAADLSQLDHYLALYGEESGTARHLLKDAVSAAHDRIWVSGGVRAQSLDPNAIRSQADRFFTAVEALAPKNELQSVARTQAIQLSQSIGQIRALMFEQTRSTVSWPFLVALMFWLGVLFLGFGLLARFHATVAAALLIGALSVSVAIFLILELGSPYSGIIQISDEPLRLVLADLATAPP